METFQKILLIITIIGAINWGFIGILNFDLVAMLFSDGSFLTRMVYTVVGICGLINIGVLFGHINFEKD